MKLGISLLVFSKGNQILGISKLISAPNSNMLKNWASSKSLELPIFKRPVILKFSAPLKRL